jgi:nucleotide-binding universal stress UspA family protein
MSIAEFTPAEPLRSVMVPLDGSRLAEAAIPAAIAVARAFQVHVVLLHVLEADPPSDIHGQPHLATNDEAIAYLRTAAEELSAAGVRVETHVHANPQRNVGVSIASHADELGIDLIVMANHGSGGIRGFLFGRVAQKVLQSGRRPVFAIPVNGRIAEPSSGVRRLALLLNRSTESESAIPIAVTFAKAFEAGIHLIFVVPTPGTLAAERSAPATLLPSAAREVLNLEERNAVEYLDQLATSIRSYGIDVTSSVARGEPSSRAVEAAERAGADLLVMTTHARGGLSGVLSGSVGSRVLARSDIPLLLVPANS